MNNYILVCQKSSYGSLISCTQIILWFPKTLKHRSVTILWDQSVLTLWQLNWIMQFRCHYYPEAPNC